MAVRHVYAHVQEGASVLCGRYAGTKVKIGDEEHMLVKEEDVLGVQGAKVADLKPTAVRCSAQLAVSAACMQRASRTCCC